LDWPAEKVERWPLDKLVPHARNARTRSEAQVVQIAASIQEWGWTVPVLVLRRSGTKKTEGRLSATRESE
jgi:ParB-like chromosome segregation protein Spo0J